MTGSLHNSTNDIPSRIKQLRELMSREGISMYMVKDSDPHDSEYVGDHFKARRFMTGFTGSNGTLVVTRDEAGLWTDGRYFIQAAGELEGSGITLFRMGEKDVPTIREYIASNLHDKDVLGFDGMTMRAKDGIEYEKIAAKAGAKVNASADLISMIWTDDRPPLSARPVTVIDEALAGESVASKLARVRESVKKAGADAYILSRLDDICYLLNIRGGDVECTPVVLSNLYMTMDETHLFISSETLDDKARDHLSGCGIILHEYDEFMPFMEKTVAGAADNHVTAADTAAINYAVYDLIDPDRIASKRGEDDGFIAMTNPTEEMEAVRNEVQLNNIRSMYIQDSAVLTRFLFAIKNEIASGAALDEYTAAMRLDEMRSRIPGFMELSFPTISAYGSNAAMMHYEATEESYSELKPEGMYLVDSGAQYLGATTDVTRTIALGPVTEDMKRDFTLCCVGMLRLADAVFLEGCTGRNLDILARGPLWKKGTDYKCGTGHGVGYMLGVHTGPQNIRYRYIRDVEEAVLKAGMTLSDEPGVYIEGEYGIRTENILEVKDAFTSSDGHFLRFEHLTWVPLDLDLIDTAYMEPHDIELLNEYHDGVYKRLEPHMKDDKERKQLNAATRHISR